MNYTDMDWLKHQDYWLWIGFAGQLLFFSRFVVQWIVSERKGESVIPISFWYLSLGGGIILFAYAYHRRDPVFTIGFAVTVLIYLRNLVMLKHKKA